MDARDWTVIGLMALIEGASIVFIFKHPEVLNFATFATLSGTLISAYHWLVIHDAKTADA